jgi:hypothetical protein
MSYSVLMHPLGIQKVDRYRVDLRTQGLDVAGTYLRAMLQGVALDGLDTVTLLEFLVATKRPQIFAESQVWGDGRDWTLRELSILGDLGFAVPVTVFDNGRHETPQVHEQPFAATLLFISGALLRNDSGNTPSDWDEVVRDGVLDSAAFQSLYERRLLPLFCYASLRGIESGRPSLITIPGLGCGQFAGPFRGRLGGELKVALMTILQKHHAVLPGIRAVYFDPYSECVNERHEFGSLSMLVRPLTKGNWARPQLCMPTDYQDVGDDFRECDLHSVVAWDHVSWPGNDFYVNSRATDDGVKAAATDVLRRLTGVNGEYDPRSYKYLPPEGFVDWSEVVSTKGCRLQIRDRLIIEGRI